MFRKTMSLLLSVLLVLSISTSVFAENTKTKTNEIYLESLRNVKITHNKGRLLHTEVIEENGFKKIKKGTAVKSNIAIKDSKIKGYIEYSSTKYQLKGELDTESEKYVGQVVNKDNYSFEVYILDEQGNILINVFDENNKPQSFLIDGSEPTYENKPSVIRTYGYADDLAEESSHGLYIAVTGPKTPTSTANDTVAVRTKSDDAWQDSGLGGYNWKVSCYVSDLDISFIPLNNWTSFSPKYPSQHEETNFNIPIYFGSIIGTQFLKLRTSSTDIDVNSDGSVDFAYTWTPAVGYTDEYDTDIDDNNKHFGAQVGQDFNGTGSITNKVAVDITYGCIAKVHEYGQNVYAYPSFSDYTYYSRTR